MEFEQTKTATSPTGRPRAPIFPIAVFIYITLTSFPALEEYKETPLSMPPKNIFPKLEELICSPYSRRRPKGSEEGKLQGPLQTTIMFATALGGELRIHRALKCGVLTSGGGRVRVGWGKGRCQPLYGDDFITMHFCNCAEFFINVH